MSLHGGIQARLSGQVSSVSTRVWRDHLPQDSTVPAISFNVRSTTRDTELGASTSESIRPILEVWSWAATHTQAKATADEVRTALHKWSGTSDSTVFGHVLYLDERDHYDPELGWFAVVADYAVMYAG